MTEGAVATSTPFRRRWRDAAGRIHTHLLDPRTGMSADPPVASVTVITSAGWLAEALAKARQDEAALASELRDLQAERGFNVILVTHDLREAVFLADTVYVMSKSPGRLVARREIELPRPRELETTYTPEFTGIVHELRAHIGAMRKPVNMKPNQEVA